MFDPVVAQDALTGLLAPRKTLPAKLFYDEEGCRLFYCITDLPEYYLTRTERLLLPQVAAHLAGSCCTLIEYGASDESKASFFLPTCNRYIPVDIAGPALQAMTARLRRSFPSLIAHQVTADFMADFALPPMPETGRIGFFPGSTIGNLEPKAATAFLARVRAQLGGQARFVLGADLRKDKSVLIPAYDDAEGVTAAFNRNILVRLNREAGADFDPMAFEHRAVWNDAESRIEMHLVSRHRQAVRVVEATIQFAAGETIHTENSYKYTQESLIGIAQAAGWALSRTWTDPDARFLVALFEAAEISAIRAGPPARQ